MSYDPLTELNDNAQSVNSTVSNYAESEKLRDLKQKEILIHILLEIKLLNLHLREISGLEMDINDLIGGEK